MKPRKYFNLFCGREASETIGYPLSLPELDGIEFAIVRPVGWVGMIPHGWQVIHVRTGLRVMQNAERTRALAKISAMAELERAGKKKGWVKVKNKLKRAKTPCIVEALKRI